MWLIRWMFHFSLDVWHLLLDTVIILPFLFLFIIHEVLEKGHPFWLNTDICFQPFHGGCWFVHRVWVWISPDLWIGCHLHFHSCQPRWPQFLYLENVNDKSYPFSAKSMLRINCIGLKSTRKTQEEPVYSNQVASCGSISYKWRIVLSNGAYVPNAMFSYFPSPSIRDKDKP